jgi:hypothetical protein
MNAVIAHESDPDFCDDAELSSHNVSKICCVAKEQKVPDKSDG